MKALRYGSGLVASVVVAIVMAVVFGVSGVIPFLQFGLIPSVVLGAAIVWAVKEIQDRRQYKRERAEQEARQNRGGQ